MHATIDVRFTISIDDHKTIPLAMLAGFLTDQNIGSVILESVVESLDASRVEAYCGEKHAHGNGDHRFQRAGTDTRTAVTTAGEHEFSLHYVEDTAADHDQSSYFRPVEDSTSTAKTAINKTSQPEASISLPLSAIVTQPITATASSEDAVADHHQPPSQRIRLRAQAVPSRLSLVVHSGSEPS